MWVSVGPGCGHRACRIDACCRWSSAATRPATRVGAELGKLLSEDVQFQAPMSMYICMYVDTYIYI